MQIFKGKAKGAKLGHSLLKKKADALKMRFQSMLKEIMQTKMAMSEQASTAYFSVTQAGYAAGNFRNKVQEVCSTPEIRVVNKIDNVAGVRLPSFVTVETGQTSSSTDKIGLAAGGKQVAACRTKFTEFVHALIKLASLQTAFVELDQALKITNRRVNALENVTIPRIEYVIKYISRELDELEREDFIRLKMLKGKKEKLIKEKREAAATAEVTENSNMLEGFDGQDEDIVF